MRAASSNAVAIFGVARQPAAADSAAKLEDTLTRKLGSAGDVQFVDLATAFPPPEPQGNPRGTRSSTRAARRTTTWIRTPRR